MEWYSAALLMCGLILFLMALGFPVAIGFLITNIVGVYLFMGGERGVSQLVANGATSVNSFLLVPIPLFIMMGELFFRSGLSKRAFDALDKLFGNFKGRLSYITIAGGTVTAAMSGSSLASTAMLGSIMVPEGERRGYKSAFIVGPLLGAGGLAILIPPSILMVLLGSLARIDVGSLLLAGLIPGLLLATFYAVAIFIMTKLDPEGAPDYAAEKISIGRKFRIFTTDVLPLSLVIVAVVGTIIAGIATPSESAAFGVLAVLVLMVFYRCFAIDVLVRAVTESLRFSVMIFFVIVGASTFSQVFAYSGATHGLVNWATGFDFGIYTMIAVIFIVLLVAGMFLDAISTMMLTIPILLPIVQDLGFNEVSFGVIMMISLEIGAVTPPLGLALYVMHSITGGSLRLSQIFMAGLPFLICSILLVVLIVAFPQLALFLPELAR
ncbi:TRAP transporter large permease [Primorskyibacter flagellatus]|uniref:TRAP transporter large permease protein n=1 Tax=Primorskyibacter flagellatus TaxID=1387277 RepID=A0A1W2DB22_9RHOB|nr:TRAP transporter large permease [Primorskyibacter flagellatus]SMC94690.1 TRAP transporter, DctM subunit [Primorskyibacter flagellatus]